MCCLNSYGQKRWEKLWVANYVDCQLVRGKIFLAKDTGEVWTVLFYFKSLRIESNYSNQPSIIFLCFSYTSRVVRWELKSISADTAYGVGCNLNQSTIFHRADIQGGATTHTYVHTYGQTWSKPNRDMLWQWEEARQLIGDPHRQKQSMQRDPRCRR